MHDLLDVALLVVDALDHAGETSDRQWRDVLAILLVQGTRLDREYMTVTASAAGVSDLLARAEGEGARPSVSGPSSMD